MWKVWLGTALNFFLLGAGYLIFTERKVLGACLTIGALLATWVEQVPLAAMEDQTPYRVMVACICCIAGG